MLVVEKVINLIAKELGLFDSVTKPSPSLSEAEVHFFQIRAASKVGYFEPFTDEQSAMNAFLKKHGASKELTEKAWGLYHKFLQESGASLKG